MAAGNSNELLHDFFPMLRHYKDGRVERLLGTDFFPPSLDAATGVQSKDIVIAPELNLSARLFLPKKDASAVAKKRPILLYFHGGGFITESAFSPLYHRHLNLLAAAADVIAVSFNYRLAPEHPLPIAFEDSWLAFKWVASQSKEEGNEEWIKKYGDMNHLYLGGDSAGGTIAHYVALRAGIKKLRGITLRGAFLNCPYFCGDAPLRNEEAQYRLTSERLWRYACPSTKGCDDPMINPAADPRLSSIGCKRLLVYVAEKDGLRGRGLYYKEALEKIGWDGEIEVVDVHGGNHVFSVLAPTREASVAMIKKVASFMNVDQCGAHSHRVSASL